MAAHALSSTDRYLCIYPAYINSKKTIGEGRRVPKEKGCENPTSNEIKDVCSAAGLKPVVENKLYPRELYRGDALYRGRIRVQLKQEDGSLVNERFSTKRSLLLYIGEMIPKLKSRSQKSSGSGDPGSSQMQSKQKRKKKR